MTLHRDRVLIACHAAANAAGMPVALFANHAALVLAFAQSAEREEWGCHSLWGVTWEPNRFFSLCLGIDPETAECPPEVTTGGLWVIEARWEDRDRVAWQDESDLRKHSTWAHLRGVFSRPTLPEVAALAQGHCPWDDGILL